MSVQISLEIPDPKSKSYLTFDYLRSCGILFFIVFLFLVLGPMISRRFKNYEDRQRLNERASNWIDYLSENPYIIVVCCLTTILLAVIAVRIKQKKLPMLKAIQIRNDKVLIGRSNLLFRNMTWLEVGLDQLECIILGKIEDRQKCVKLVDKSSSRTLALLYPSHSIYLPHYEDIKVTFKQMNDIGVSNRKEPHSRWDSWNETLKSIVYSGSN